MKEIYGQFDPEYGKKADLHIHSNLSDGTLSPQQIVDLASHLEIDAIAITDHDMVHPAEIAREYVEKNNVPIELVIGSEITTETNGKRAHLIGLFLDSPIAKHQSVPKTLYEIHRQGGLAIIPHANFLHMGFSSFSEAELNNYLQTDDPEVYFDGFEVSNGGLLLVAKRKLFQGKAPPKAYDFALKFYRQHQEKLGAAIGSSDAHRMTLELSLTGYEDDLKSAITNAQTSVMAPDTYEEFTDQYSKAKDFFIQSEIQSERSRHLF